jgi:hypothetical protein
MGTHKNSAAQALLKSIGDGGTEWLFVALSDGWAITRDGKEVAVGASDWASVSVGVRQFESLTASVPVATACDARIRDQLDRIEAARPIRGAMPNERPKKDRVIPEVSVPFSLVRRRPARNVRKQVST